MAALVSSFIEQLHANVFIEDENGKLLFGNTDITPAYQEAVIFDNETLGYVKGDEKTPLITSLLQLLYVKEAERKKLGSEVLNLYQNVNLMFNFSDKLAQAIGAPDISTITLTEARGVIKSDNAVIVLWEESGGRLKVMASAGELFFDEEIINKELSLLLKLILSGQSEIITDISFLKEAGIISTQVQSLIYSALKVNQRIMGAIILAGNNPEQYAANDLKLLTTLALQSSAAIESALLYEKNIQEAREREEAMRRIYKATNKFVPNEFIKSLGHDVITDVKLGDFVEKIVTVLFIDIRDFTTLSEKMTPEENFKFVSSFNARMGPVIRSNNGFINQYLGDSIMAIFPDNPVDALLAAVKMHQAIQELNEERALENRPPIKAGIGMHTGPLIMGITGDEYRLDAATISDTVNTAARIESLTKYYKSPLLLSHDTLHYINGQHDFHFRHLGAVRLKGKHKQLSIAECINSFDHMQLDKKLKTLSLFTEAMGAYHERQFESALHLFQLVLKTDPDDLTAIFFHDNARKYLQEGVPANWTGVEEMMFK